jgi:glycine cleavage system T protein (aminomethyltransferase)
VTDEIIPVPLLLNASAPRGRYASHFKGGLRVTGFHPLMGARAEAMKLHNTFLKPWAFGTIEDEYAALRDAAVLIDVTGEEVIEATGPDAVAVLDRLVPRDIVKLASPKCAYAVMCYPYGGIIEDGIIAKFSDERVWWCGGPAASEQWIYQHSLGADVTVVSKLDELHVLSIQGPRSREILAASGLDDVDDVPYFGLIPEGEICGIPVVVTRTGYTAELGYDIYVEASLAPDLCAGLLAVGIEYGLGMCGSRTLNVRRVEAGILDVGIEFDWRHTPLDCGLDWMVDLDREFVGRDALREQSANGVDSQLIGLTVDPGQELERGDEVTLNGESIGIVTSAVLSPELGYPVGIARVEAQTVSVGDSVHVRALGRGWVTAVVATLPFVDPERRRSRA